MKKEYSLAQKLKFIKTKGNILPFKDPSKNDGYKQIITLGVEKQKGSYRITGELGSSSAWTDSKEELADLIDWEFWAQKVEINKELIKFKKESGEYDSDLD